MKPELTRRIIGGVAAGSGLWWTCFVGLRLLIGNWPEDVETYEILFLSGLTLLMAIPGVIALIFGVRLFLKMSESSLRWVVGVGAGLVVLMLASRLSLVFSRIIPDKLLGNAMLFISSLMVIPVYLYVVRSLLRRLTQKNVGILALLSNGILALMAFQVWLILGAVIEEYAPLRFGNTRWSEEPWGIIGFVAPIIVAYGSYRFVVSKWEKARQPLRSAL